MFKLKWPEWLKIKRRNRVVESIDRLTQAICDLERGRQKAAAETRSLLEDPEKLVEIFQRIYQVIAPSGGAARVGAPAPVALLGQVGAPGQRLSKRKVKKAVELVTQAVTERMGEIEKHVQEALADLPPHTITKIAERIKAGEPFVVRRRRPDCITLDFGYGDEEYYLGL